jgi:hypothetical protein
MHKTKKAEELLRSKLEFEEFASKHGIKIQSIREDNGVYTAKMFQDACLKKQQQLSLEHSDSLQFTRNNCKIYIHLVYNRQLTDSEILQNYNATKGRFGL